MNEIFPDSGREVRRNFNPGIELVVNRGEGESAIRMNDIVQGYVLGVTGEPKPETGVITVGGTEFQYLSFAIERLKQLGSKGEKTLCPPTSVLRPTPFGPTSLTRGLSYFLTMAFLAC